MSIKKATFKQRFWRKIAHVGEERISSGTVNVQVRPWGERNFLATVKSQLALDWLSEGKNKWEVRGEMRSGGGKVNNIQ